MAKGKKTEKKSMPKNGWDDQVSETLRDRLYAAIKQGRAGEHAVAHIVGESIKRTDATRTLAWLKAVCSFPPASASKYERMGQLYLEVPDLDVWKALGYSQLRRLVGLVPKERLPGALADVLAAANGYGLVTSAKRHVDETIERHGGVLPPKAKRKKRADGNDDMAALQAARDLLAAELRRLASEFPVVHGYISAAARAEAEIVAPLGSMTGATVGAA